MKQVLREIYREVLRKLDPERLLRIPQEAASYDRGLVVAIGKAAFSMAFTARGVTRLPGLAVGPRPVPEPPAGWRFLPGDHPLPDAQSLAAATEIEKALRPLCESDLVLFLLSGGGSALCERPLPILTTQRLREIHATLIRSGARIAEINTVRKHLSAVKGGRLAAGAAPARQMTLYFSDVPPGEEDAVASGPTMPDPSTLADCRAIAERLGIALPQPLPETPKPGDAIFSRSTWECLASNELAVHELAAAARARGWIVEIDHEADEWPLERACDHLLQRLRALRAGHPGGTVAIAAGGEILCPVTGSGRGGRNQQFVLACADRIAGESIAVLSAGTDGIDGNSPAAGAVADGETALRAGKNAIAQALIACDAYPLLTDLEATIKTGPTGTNLRDLRLLVALQPDVPSLARSFGLMRFESVDAWMMDG